MNSSPNLIHDIQEIISQTRALAARSVNFERVMMNWKIGERIFEELQRGEERVEYGAAIIKGIS